MVSYTFPSFEDLPKVSGTPQGCVWGFYDRDGKKDEVGCDLSLAVNLLTEEVVLAAKEEIKIGRSIQLDWPLHNLEFPGFGRRKLEHKVIDLTHSLNNCGFDDEIHVNTQCGSQWDSLKHVSKIGRRTESVSLMWLQYAYQKDKVFYNGLKYEDALKSDTNGIHNVKTGAREAVSFYEKRDGQAPDAWTTHQIPVADVKAALSKQFTRPKQGDILMLRTGYVRQHSQATAEQRKQGTCDRSTAIGLQANEETIRWLYSQHFSAHVADSVAFEAWPPAPDNDYIIHEWSLVWWGAPLGEMWNLEELAAECARLKRWTFFLTSAPLHVRGGVGSPPGAIAVF
ncbi:hypothetical protein LTR86_006932 [Recurvomyces mirabilis]|nr:hypothetical protein LTR86_006932 [Recurvomyces mirabilis]